MAYFGKYGNLPAVDAAKLHLMDAEKGMNEEEWTYIRAHEWRKSPTLLRLYYEIMGLQMVILKNGHLLAFSQIPRLWFPSSYSHE